MKSSLRKPTNQTTSIYQLLYQHLLLVPWRLFFFFFFFMCARNETIQYKCGVFLFPHPALLYQSKINIIIHPSSLAWVVILPLSVVFMGERYTQAAMISSLAFPTTVTFFVGCWNYSTLYVSFLSFSFSFSLYFYYFI